MILLVFMCATLWAIWIVVAFFRYRPRPILGATVVVTGACSELGRRLCAQLYARGARVVAWDYSKLKLQELQADVLKAALGSDASSDASCAPEGGNRAGSGSGGAPAGLQPSDDFMIMAVDVSSRLQVQRAAKEMEQLGAVDVIINAAHTYPTKPLSDRADDSAERVLQANTLAPLWVVRQLLPLLLARSSTSPMTSTTTAAGATARGARRRDDYAQVVNIVATSADYTLDSDSPEYAASQWGAVGLHYSMRDWIAVLRNSNGRKGAAAAPVTGSASTPTAAREVRMTLLCLDDVQLGTPTALSASLPTAAARAASSPTTPSTSPATGSPERDSGVLGARGRAASSTYRDSYTQAVQRRNAELDRAAGCCVDAICRGQERYCHRAAWSTTVMYPVMMAFPLPWAARLLRWWQNRKTAAAGAAEA